jgi:hypothetical protein
MLFVDMVCLTVALVTRPRFHGSADPPLVAVDDVVVAVPRDGGADGKFQGQADNVTKLYY